MVTKIEKEKQNRISQRTCRGRRADTSCDWRLTLTGGTSACARRDRVECWHASRWWRCSTTRMHPRWRRPGRMSPSRRRSNRRWTDPMTPRHWWGTHHRWRRRPHTTGWWSHSWRRWPTSVAHIRLCLVNTWLNNFIVFKKKQAHRLL